VYRRVLPTILALALLPATVPAQTDLDELMSRVLEHRDENWAKLQQYVLDEREVLKITGPGGLPIYGFSREYVWFPENGIFVRSPRRANGVDIGEAERERAERRWLARERRRAEAEQKERDGVAVDADGVDIAATAPPGSDAIGSDAVGDVVSQALEPRFVQAAYFLRFKFDPGQYAFAGRETLQGREALRIEYYPTKLFSEGRARPNRELREREDEIEEKMNKVALVTLWIDPAEHQILKYEFANMDYDFLPGRTIVRVDDVHASMEMGQPFEGVWLPQSIRIGVRMGLAVGDVSAEYTTRYEDYRLAEVTTRVR
jgi:hypothetical protein